MSTPPKPTSPSYDGDGEEGNGLDLKVLVLFAVGRHRILVGVCTALGILASALFAFSLPNTYTAEGKLRLLAGKRETLTSEASAGVQETSLTPAMADEMMLLNDEGVYRAAARAIGPMRVLRPDDPRESTGAGAAWHRRVINNIRAAVLASRTRHLDDPSITQEELLVSATKVMKNNSKLIAVPHSSVIAVLVTATSPESARDFTNTLMEECIAEHRQAYAIEGLMETNKAKRDSVEKEFIEAQTAYSEYMDEVGFVQLDVQLAAMIAQLTSQERELAEMRADFAGKKAQHENLENSLEEMPKTIEQTRLPVLGPNVQITRLEEEYRITQREKMRTINDPGLARGSREQYERYYEQLLLNIEKELDDLPEIVEVVPAITEEVSNPEHDTLSRMVIELAAEMDGLAIQIERLELGLEGQRERLSEARVAEPILYRMERELKDKEAQLIKLNSMASELELLELLEQQGDSNLKFMSSATLPRSKDGPKRSKMILMGLAAGLGLGAGISVLRQLLDPRLRYPRTLERDYELEVLAVVPELSGLNQDSSIMGEASASESQVLRA